MDKQKTHKKAVALRYLPGEDNAPKVIAKGRRKAAQKIIEMAKSHGIPITEDPDLVESLVALDWYQEIPPELYRVVAEILAFAYDLNKEAETP